MTAPLSQDLRERIVLAVDDGSTIRQAARRFAVSASAAIKLMQRVRQTGSPAPAKIGGSRRPLLEKHADELRGIVSSKAGITLREIKAALAARDILVKALSTMADMLHRLGLSHKKEPESQRARPARCRPAPQPLAGVAALHGCGPLRVPGRDRRVHEHGPALWLGSQGRAPGRCGPTWALVHHDLCGWLTGERDHRTFRAGWADDGEGVPRLRRAGAGA